MRKLLALWVAVFSLLGFAAIVAVVALRPEEEVPVPEPVKIAYPDNFAITYYTPVIYGRNGEYVAGYCDISYPSNLTSDLFSYQWYVYSSTYGYWRPSSLPGYNTNEISFQMNSSRKDYLFCCVVSSSAYDYSIMTPVISCRQLESYSKSDNDNDIVLDYYEPWELEDLDKDTLAAYEEKQKERVS